ncbi:16S rRNA (guanine(527)-N(7))-methyltransferase RsmG [Altericroceibacterium endophyticum]|uniref:Ribosomal RNA small subunit methyltransferase G n=1 Tax=Altericroceibacterium endophyticum TaxID=1808508 RepID=A0A6I4T419_9SPHN|nr:16S rRNA (guanine(527)-N(7))-methyltransferase RsmG [Altericroceibacterium endophyticum]MXO65657.1 16S rRNA (guanine(527)-N(7))-methyltransferase RsmG [Altericroceibacterium endophyticum]
MIESEDQARELCATLAQAGGTDADAALGKLDQLAAMLSSENERQNLVSRASLDQIWLRHLADSAQLLSYDVPRETSNWLDLGTGAGFPGLVIAALRPEMDVFLVESRKRRIEWLESAVDSLSLSKCHVLGARLEDVESFKADVISARAFAPLPKLVKLAQRFATEETLWLLPKGKSAQKELTELPNRQSKLFHVEQSVTSSEAGVIVGRLNL